MTFGRRTRGRRPRLRHHRTFRGPPIETPDGARAGLPETWTSAWTERVASPRALPRRRDACRLGGYDLGDGRARCSAARCSAGVFRAGMKSSNQLFFHAVTC